MQEKNEFLGTESIGKLLFKLSLPTIAAQIINMLYNLVDRVYIGHIPDIGGVALTGVGVCMPIIMIMASFAALVSQGGSTRASIHMGQNDNDRAEKILGNCFMLQSLIAIVLTAVLLIWNREFLLMFGASENTISYATDYMNIYALGTLSVQLTLGLNAFITAQGFAKTSMKTVVIGAVLNIILDPIFIFGFDMGVKGAALATIISQSISAIWVVYFLCGKKTIIKIKKCNLKIKKEIIMPCVALGIAPFIMQSSESVIAICFNASLLRFGGDIAVGAMTILTSVMQFSLLPLQGLSQGAQPVMGYNFGAQKADRVKKSFKLLLLSSVIYSTLIWALVMLFPQAFAMIFTSDAALIAFTNSALHVYGSALLLMGIQIACQMTLLSLGNSKASVILAVVRKFLLLIPLIYILPNFFADKTMAVYLAEPVSDIIAVTITVILFAFEFKKAMKKMNESSKKAEK
ncbi:MAG: MATE family efflux transporter [Oscillospiraceae bacterium]